MLPNDLYHVMLNVKGKRYPAGRFLVHDGQVHHLENYHDVMDVPEGVIDDYTIARIAKPRPGVDIVSEADLRSGKRLDMIPTASLQPLPQPGPTAAGHPLAVQAQVKKPRPIWHYKRVGHDMPHVLEHHGGGKYTLDGNVLKPEEFQTILGNVRSKAATLRYKDDGIVDTITKFEKMFSTLRKEEDEDMDPEEALQHLESVHAANPHPATAAAIKSLRRRVFEDPMNPGLGNKYAYEQFRKKNVPGVWASLDLNDLKHANDVHGHDVGDALIRAAGGAIRQGVDPSKAKAFRAGGDEYVMHFPDPETAFHSIRQVRNHMEQVPAVAGVYKPSFSVGFGPSFEHADSALKTAKQGKYLPGQEHIVDDRAKKRAFDPGKTPSLAHSLVPGFEGTVPLHPAQLPISAPSPTPAAPHEAAPQPSAPAEPAPSAHAPRPAA
jgi:diguanylate cyclase (GGDEF)-like protein